MKKIILIAGLPGSGKEHLAAELGRTEPNCAVLDGRSAIATFDAAGTDTLVVYSREFCLDAVREETARQLREKYGSQCPLEWIFFENRACLCMENVGHRRRHADNRQIAAEILALSRHYHPPEAARVERVIIEKAHH